MKLENPFPGMNPWLEIGWENAHAKLLASISDALNESLPPDLRVRTEEGVTIGAGDSETGRGVRRRPDVAVTESWKHGLPPQWQPEGAAGDTLLAEPDQIVQEETVPPRWLEITDRTGRLVSVIEPSGDSGRYWQTDYTRPLPQPLNAADMAWATQRLQEAGLL